jgi:hypothetical protein
VVKFLTRLNPTLHSKQLQFGFNGGDMANLLHSKFLQNAYENYGDSVLDWPDDYKDTAVVNAMTGGDHDEFKECMTDFFANDGILSLYTMRPFHAGGSRDIREHEFAIDQVKNSVWSALESTFQDELDAYIESLIESAEGE